MRQPPQPKPGEPITLEWIRLGPDGKRTPESEFRYRVVLNAGVHKATGKRRQVRSTHLTLSDARAHIAATRTDRNRGVYVAPDRTTFTDFVADWMERQRSRGEDGPRPITLTGYGSALKHPIAAFGSKPLGKITRGDVEALVTKLVKAGRTKRHVAFVIFVLRKVLNDAVDHELIARNVALRVKPGGKASGERQALTTAELAKLRAHFADDRLHAIWLLVLSGLRRSEVLGLQWTDIDLADGAVSITKAVVPDHGGRRCEPTPPKTKNGTRTLPLPPDMLTALRELRKAQLTEWGAVQARTGFIAVDEAGRPYRPEVLSQLWAEHVAAAGVQTVSLHSARHSSVTAMRDAGVPDHIVAAWHGHDETIMRRVYSHAHRDQMEAAGRTLSDVLTAAQPVGQ